MAQSYFRHRRGASATFDLFVRKMPQNRSYLVFAGLEDIIAFLQGLKFSRNDIGYLASIGFDKDFLSYLKDFRFRGDVLAMPEGTVFFPGEAVVRVTGSLIEAQIVESFLLNAVNFSTMIASKASRIYLAAEGRGVYDFSLRRTHGVDSSIKAARSSYIAGFRGTSNVLASKLYGIKAVGTMAHSYVMSFAGEEDSFRAFFNTFPEKCILLVDTYEVKEGITNAIRIAGEFNKRGYSLKGIRLDSGDILKLSRTARRMLDRAGLKETRIFASGDLDEYKIKRLVQMGAPVDDFGVGTRMGTSSDAPSLDVIYKICEVTNDNGAFLPTMKLSEDKVTLPGRKQVFRLYDKKGLPKKDIIGLESENPGKPLLEKVIRAGEIVYPDMDISAIRDATLKNLASLKDELKALRGGASYPVLISPKLKKMINGLSRELKKRQGFKKP